MRFFKDLRPEIYIHGAKLRRDKKTGKRLWGFTLINTLIPEQVTKCDATIEAAYIYLLTLENAAAEVLLLTLFQACAIDFFAKAEDKKSALHLDAADLGLFRMTRSGKVAELWFQFELENSAARLRQGIRLHARVGAVHAGERSRCEVSSDAVSRGWSRIG